MRARQGGVVVAAVLTVLLAGFPVRPAVRAQVEVVAPIKTRPSHTVAEPRNVIWRDPGDVAALDFTWGAGGREGAPKPPFKFVEENLGGTSPKVKVTDALGREYSVKWGHEVHAECIATRIAWAAGYFVEPSYYVPSGVIVGAHDLKRARDRIDEAGQFKDARFELKVDTIDKRKDEDSWTWLDNPFVGTKELNGLKIVVMLTSNWDNKDARDLRYGSNTAVYVVETDHGPEARYLITDWGASFGRWGHFLNREKWDMVGFVKQSPEFLEVKGDRLDWGYAGQHTYDFKRDITKADVIWIRQYLSRITDDQLRAGMRASGATPEAVDGYTRALRTRIDELDEVDWATR